MLHALLSHKKCLICIGLCAMAMFGAMSSISSAMSGRSTLTDGENWMQLWVEDLNDTTTVYAVRREGNLILVGTRDQGLFRSDDAGATWQRPSQLQDSYVRDIWLQSGGSTVLAATYGYGLWRSMDGGSTWSPTGTQINTPRYYSLVSGQTIVYVGTAEKGVWKSPDLGQSWNPTGVIISPGTVTLAAASDLEVYAGTVDNGIFKTADGGASWQQIGSDFAGKTVRAIAVDPQNPNWLVTSVLNDGIYKVYLSQNAGSSWTAFGNGLDDASVLSLLITNIGDDRYVLAGTDDHGVFCLDADTWVPWGLAGRDIYSLSTSGDALYAGTDRQVWSSLHVMWLPVILRQ